MSQKSVVGGLAYADEVRSRIASALNRQKAQLAPGQTLENQLKQNPYFRVETTTVEKPIVAETQSQVSANIQTLRDIVGQIFQARRLERDQKSGDQEKLLQSEINTRKALTDQLEKSLEENHELKRSIAGLREESGKIISEQLIGLKRSYENNLAKSEDEKNDLTKKMTGLADELNELRRKIGGLNEERSQFNKHLAACNDEKNQFNKHLANLNEEKNQLNKNLAHLSEEKNQLNKALFVINEEKNQLSKSLAAFGDEKNQLSQKIASLIEEKNQLNKSIDPLAEEKQRKAGEQFSTEKKNLMDKIAKLEEEKENIRKQLSQPNPAAEQQTAISQKALADKLAKAEEDNKQLRQALVKQSEDPNKVPSEKLVEAHQKISDLEIKLFEERGQTARLAETSRQALQKAKDAEDVNRSQAEKYQSRIAQLEAQIRGKPDSAAETSALEKKLQAQVEKLKEMDALKSHLQTLQAELKVSNSRFEGERESLKIQLATVSKDLDRQNQINNELKPLSNQLKLLQQEKAENESQIENLKAELQKERQAKAKQANEPQKQSSAIVTEDPDTNPLLNELKEAKLALIQAEDEKALLEAELNDLKNKADDHNHLTLPIPADINKDKISEQLTIAISAAEKNARLAAAAEEKLADYVRKSIAEKEQANVNFINRENELKEEIQKLKTKYTKKPTITVEEMVITKSYSPETEVAPEEQIMAADEDIEGIPTIVVRDVSELESLRNENNDLKDAVAYLEDIKKGLENKSDELERRLQESQSELAKLKPAETSQEPEDDKPLDKADLMSRMRRAIHRAAQEEAVSPNRVSARSYPELDEENKRLVHQVQDLENKLAEVVVLSPARSPDAHTLRQMQALEARNAELEKLVKGDAKSLIEERDALEKQLRIESETKTIAEYNYVKEISELKKDLEAANNKISGLNEEFKTTAKMHLEQDKKNLDELNSLRSQVGQSQLSIAETKDVNRDLQKQRDKIQALETELASIKEQRNAPKAKVDELNTAKQAQPTPAQTSNEDALKKQIQDAQKKIEELTKSLSTISGENQKSQDQIKALSAELNQQKETAKDLQNKLNTELSQKSQEAKPSQKLAQLEGELSKLKGELDSARKSLQAAEKEKEIHASNSSGEIEKLKELLAHASKDREDLNRKANEFQTQLQKSEAEKADLNKKIAAAESNQKESFTKQLDEAKASQKEALEKVKALEQELSKAKSTSEKSSGLANELNESQNAVKNLQAQVKELENLKTLPSQIEKYKKDLDEVNKQLETRAKTIQDLKNLEPELQAAKKQLADLQAKKEVTSNEDGQKLKHAEGELEKARAQIADLNKQLSSAATTNQNAKNLEDELKAARALIVDMQNTLIPKEESEAKIKQFETDSKKSLDKISDLEKKLKANEEELKNLKASDSLSDKLNNEINSLNKKIQEQSTKISELSALQPELEASNGKIQQLESQIVSKTKEAARASDLEKELEKSKSTAMDTSSLQKIESENKKLQEDLKKLTAEHEKMRTEHEHCNTKELEEKIQSLEEELLHMKEASGSGVKKPPKKKDDEEGAEGEEEFDDSPEGMKKRIDHLLEEREQLINFVNYFQNQNQNEGEEEEGEEGEEDEEGEAKSKPSKKKKADLEEELSPENLQNIEAIIEGLQTQLQEETQKNEELMREQSEIAEAYRLLEDRAHFMERQLEDVKKKKTHDTILNLHQNLKNISDELEESKKKESEYVERINQLEKIIEEIAGNIEGGEEGEEGGEGEEGEEDEEEKAHRLQQGYENFQGEEGDEHDQHEDFGAQEEVIQQPIQLQKQKFEPHKFTGKSKKEESGAVSSEIISSSNLASLGFGDDGQKKGTTKTTRVETKVTKKIQSPKKR